MRTLTLIYFFPVLKSSAPFAKGWKESLSLSSLLLSCTQISSESSFFLSFSLFFISFLHLNHWWKLSLFLTSFFFCFRLLTWRSHNLKVAIVSTFRCTTVSSHLLYFFPVLKSPVKTLSSPLSLPPLSNEKPTKLPYFFPFSLLNQKTNCSLGFGKSHDV